MIGCDTTFGSRVRFTDKHGHDHERETAKDVYGMVAGNEYTVASLRVEAWRAWVAFKEIPGGWFNTVMFDGVDDVAPLRSQTGIDAALQSYHAAVKPLSPDAPVTTVPRQVADALALQLTAFRNAGRADS